MDYRGYRNEGVLPSVYLEDHHDAIVTRRLSHLQVLKTKRTRSMHLKS